MVHPFPAIKLFVNLKNTSKKFLDGDASVKFLLIEIFKMISLQLINHESISCLPLGQALCLESKV